MKKATLLGVLFLGAGFVFGQTEPIKQEKAVAPVLESLRTSQGEQVPYLTALSDVSVKTFLADGETGGTSWGMSDVRNKRSNKAAKPAPYRCGFDGVMDFEDEWIAVDGDGDGRTWTWRDHNNWATYNGDTNSGFLMSLFRAGESVGYQEDFLITRSPVSMPAGKAYVAFHYGSKMDGFCDSLRVYYGTSDEADVAGLHYIGQIVKATKGWEHTILTCDIPAAGDYYFHFVNCSRAGQFGIWLDNIEIGAGTYIGLNPDVALSRMVLPVSSCGLGKDERLSLQVTNTGLSVINKMRLTYQIDGGTPVVQEISEPLPISKSKYYELEKRMDLSAEKAYTVTAKVEVIESVSGGEEVRVDDNEGEGGVSHFSRAELPLAMDFSADEGLRQVGYDPIYWEETTESQVKCLSGLVQDAPLVTRCVALEAGLSYRIGVRYKAGGLLMETAVMPSNFDVLYGEVGTPVGTWETLKVYADENGGYTGGEFVWDEAVLTPEMSGDYSFAIVPRATQIGYLGMLYIAGVTVNGLADHDVRLMSVRSSIGRYTPASHAVRPQFDVMVVNRGMGDEDAVRVTVKNGESEVAVSDETKVKVGDTALYTMAGAMEKPAENTEVTLMFEAVMAATDEMPDDNRRAWTFNATDGLYAYDDTIPDYEDGVGLYGVPIGNIFTLAERDTLTGISIGWYDLTGVVASPIKVGLDVYAVDAVGNVGTCYLSVDFQRQTRGNQMVDIPARVLPAGRYFVAVRQLTSMNMALGFDDNPEGRCYVMTGGRVVDMAGFGYVAVRALFGKAETVPAKDMEVLAITSPRERGVFAANETVEALCINNGHEAMAVTFKCTVNGKEQTKTLDVVGYELIRVRYEYDLSAVGAYDIQVEAIAADDEIADNNAQSLTVNCVSADPYVMDFELCEDFSLALGPWKTVDRDRDSTCGITGLSWPNVGVPMGFMAFNPAEVPMTTITPHDGERLGAAFASLNVTNNDWLISPLLRMAETAASVRFYARAFSPSYKEKFNVLVSTASDKPEDFKRIGSTYTASTEWEEIVVDLSEYNGKEAYIAIQCVSKQAFIFLIDDIVVTRPLPTESVEDLSHYVRSYPNPATDRWTVTAYGLEINRVEICDLTGSIVFRSADRLATDTYRVNTGGFTPGLYMARVYTNAGVQTLKVIVR